MNLEEIPCRRAVLAAVLASLAALWSAALFGAAFFGAAAGAAPPGSDAVTERVRGIIHEADGDSSWGADPPAEETAERGEPFAATALSGSGHAMVLIGSDGRPMGSHLRLLHAAAAASPTTPRPPLGVPRGGGGPAGRPVGRTRPAVLALTAHFSAKERIWL